MQHTEAKIDMGELAWAEIRFIMTRVGMWNHVWQTDGATADAVKAIGGFEYLSCLSPPEIGRLKNAFIGAYDRAVLCGRLHTLGEVIGPRDRNQETGEFVPLTSIETGVIKAVTIKAGACRAMTANGPYVSPESIVIIQDDTKQHIVKSGGGQMTHFNDRVLYIDTGGDPVTFDSFEDFMGDLENILIGAMINLKQGVDDDEDNNRQAFFLMTEIALDRAKSLVVDKFPKAYSRHSEDEAKQELKDAEAQND